MYKGRSNDPTFEVFSTLFYKERSAQIYAAMTKRGLSIRCASCREVSHVWVLLLCTPNLTKEASTDESFDCCATIDDPIALSYVGQDVLGANVSIATVFVINDQIGDVVLLREDKLMLRCWWDRSMFQTTTNSECAGIVNEWTQRNDFVIL